MTQQPSSAVKWGLGCGAAALFALFVCCCGLGGLFYWLSKPPPPVSTLRIVPQTPSFIAHSRPDPKDPGVRETLHYIATLMGRRQHRPFNPRSIPKDLRSVETIALIASIATMVEEVTAVGETFGDKMRWAIAINGRPEMDLMKRSFWMMLRLIGHRYKDAVYVTDQKGAETFGFYRGTLLFADTEYSFRRLTDHIEQTPSSPPSPLRFLSGHYDAILILFPKRISRQSLPLKIPPIERVEIGLDLWDADTLKGQTVWVCRDEGQAQEVATALQSWLQRLARDLSKEGLKISLQGHKKASLYFLTFRLTGLRGWLRHQLRP